jgi:hypothetical protein
MSEDSYDYILAYEGPGHVEYVVDKSVNRAGLSLGTSIFPVNHSTHTPYYFITIPGM